MSETVVLKSANEKDRSKGKFGSVEPQRRGDIISGSYRISPPAVKPSRLASKEKGGIGKDLSEGWGLNFSVGCTHGCIFCYADQIHRRRLGALVSEVSWGHYFFTPENLDEVVERTPWENWKGKEVLMSATHDPYLPQLHKWTRKILKTAFPEGVKFCIQTRSAHILKDMDVLEMYRDQVRVQVSIATFDSQFYRVIEPHVGSPELRLKVIEEAKRHGIETGVIIAPIFPPNRLRPDCLEDLKRIFAELAEVKPDRVFGEIFHVRGKNLRLVESVLGETISKKLTDFDSEVGKKFGELLSEYNFNGQWWPEHKKW